MLNGYTHAKDRATGKSIHPLLMRTYPTREQFGELELDEPELDPILAMRHLNALVSPHPYDLEAVYPAIDYDLSKYRLTDDMDVISGMDSRTDLLTSEGVRTSGTGAVCRNGLQGLEHPGSPG